MDCKCTWREYMVGDGCDQCNPQQALERAAERIAELEAEIEVIERNDFDQVLQLRGKVAELEARAEAAESKLATRTRVYTDVVDRLEARLAAADRLAEAWATGSRADIQNAYRKYIALAAYNQAAKEAE